MSGYILFTAKHDENEGKVLAKLRKKLKPCPICGRKAFLSHDIVDGFDFGYAVGCPVAKISDGIHGFDDYDSFHAAQLTFLGLYNKEEAVKIWNNRCKGVKYDK